MTGEEDIATIWIEAPIGLSMVVGLHLNCSRIEAEKHHASLFPLASGTLAGMEYHRIIRRARCAGGVP